VPRLAVMAKYLSRNGVRIMLWSEARYGVSHRTRGRRAFRRSYRHFGRARLSGGRCQRHCLRTSTLEKGCSTVHEGPAAGQSVAREGRDKTRLSTGISALSRHGTGTYNDASSSSRRRQRHSPFVRRLPASWAHRRDVRRSPRRGRVDSWGRSRAEASVSNLRNSAPGWAAAAKRASSGRDRIRRGGGCETLTW
jgi:hypothetical protein